MPQEGVGDLAHYRFLELEGGGWKFPVQRVCQKVRGRFFELKDGGRDVRGHIFELKDGSRDVRGHIFELKDGGRDVRGRIFELKDGARNVRQPIFDSRNACRDIRRCWDWLSPAFWKRGRVIGGGRCERGGRRVEGSQREVAGRGCCSRVCWCRERAGGCRPGG